MLPGPQGPAGPAGVTSARGETLPPGSEVEVSLENRVLTVKVPRGDKGDTGDAATVRIGEVVTGEPGGEASVANSGDEHAAILDFTIPKGQKGDKGDGLQIDYTAASSGELPTSGVTEGQTGIVNGELFVWDGSQWLSQGQMQGAKGDDGAPGQAATVSVGRVTTGEPGTDAVVSNSGTTSAAVLDFTIPRGEDGAPGAKGDPGADGTDGIDGEDAVVETIPVTFESSLFASGVTARKSVAGLGSVNMISPAADAANVAVIQAAGPVLAQDHGDDSSIPEGMVQLTVATAPTADMDFVITVLRSEA